MQTTQELPVISRLLTQGGVVVPMRSADKAAVLDDLLAVVCSNGLVLNGGEVRRAVLDREKQLSTGVGHGLAIPHARTDAVSGTIAVLGILERPIDYSALDGEPVQIVFMLLGPRNDTSKHIQILSRISLLMSNDEMRGQLMSVASAEAALALFRSLEDSLVSN